MEAGCFCEGQTRSVKYGRKCLCCTFSGDRGERRFRITSLIVNISDAHLKRSKQPEGRSRPFMEFSGLASKEHGLPQGQAMIDAEGPCWVLDLSKRVGQVVQETNPA